MSEQAHIGFETRHGTILTKITRIMKRYYVSVTETLNKVVISPIAKNIKASLSSLTRRSNHIL
nr:MAG TPA: hypothetical protein [Caudoviricetes sp.]